MTTRRSVAALGLVALTVIVVMVPADPRTYAAPPAFAGLVAALLLASWPDSRRHVASAAMAVAAVSVGVTILTVLGGRPQAEPDGGTTLWILLEPAVLGGFVFLAVRWASMRSAVWAAGAAGVASGVTVQRFDESMSGWGAVGASGVWLVPPLAVAGFAWHLRNLEAGRIRAVEEAQQQQRLDLAADLHDFVAHDVSEIVAQAQAGRMVLADKDPQVDEMLGRIEAAGLRALASMDRTVHMLRDAGRNPIGTLSDVPALVERFESAGPAVVELELDRTAEVVPREESAAAYRVVVEALTNVRRHGGPVSKVDVTVRVTDDVLHVVVVDDGAGGTATSRHASGGLGLAGLTARLAALGGELEAGPRASRGWRLNARLPLPDGKTGRGR